MIASGCLDDWPEICLAGRPQYAANYLTFTESWQPSRLARPRAGSQSGAGSARLLARAVPCRERTGLALDRDRAGRWQCGVQERLGCGWRPVLLLLPEQGPAAQGPGGGRPLPQAGSGRGCRLLPPAKAAEAPLARAWPSAEKKIMNSIAPRRGWLEDLLLRARPYPRCPSAAGRGASLSKGQGSEAGLSDSRPVGAASHCSPLLLNNNSPLP